MIIVGTVRDVITDEVTYLEVDSATYPEGFARLRAEAAGQLIAVRVHR